MLSDQENLNKYYDEAIMGVETNPGRMTESKKAISAKKRRICNKMLFAEIFLLLISPMPFFETYVCWAYTIFDPDVAKNKPTPEP